MNEGIWNLPWLLGDLLLEALEVLESLVALLVPKQEWKCVTPVPVSQSRSDCREWGLVEVGQTENSLVSQVLPDPPVLEDPPVLGFPVHPENETKVRPSLLTVANVEPTWRSTLGPGKPRPLSPGGPVAPLWPRSPFKVKTNLCVVALI